MRFHGKKLLKRSVCIVKAGFHMIADDRRSQKVLRSSAIIWKHTSAIACDRDRRRSWKIEPCSIFCDHLRSFAILRSYGNQSSAFCDRNVSHNTFNSDRWFNASKLTTREYIWHFRWTKCMATVGSAIVCDYMETGLFEIVCDLRSFAIIWKPAFSFAHF